MSETGPTTTTTPPAQQPATGGLGGATFTPMGVVSEGKKYEQAIGVEGQRVTEVATGTRTYEGYMAPSQQARIASGMGVPFVPNIPKIEPRYFSEDIDKLGSMSRGYIANWQMKMNQAGLLGNEFTMGVADNSTLSAYREVLGVANREGVSDAEAVQLIAQRRVKLGGGTVTRYRLTNEDDVKAIVDSVAQQLLGRTLSDDQAARIARAFQQEELSAQKAYAAGGAVQEAPGVQQFVTSSIEKDFGEQVDTRKLGDIFGSIDAMLKAGK